MRQFLFPALPPWPCEDNGTSPRSEADRLSFWRNVYLLIWLILYRSSLFLSNGCNIDGVSGSVVLQEERDVCDEWSYWLIYRLFTWDRDVVNDNYCLVWCEYFFYQNILHITYLKNMMYMYFMMVFVLLAANLLKKRLDLLMSVKRDLWGFVILLKGTGDL